MRIWLVILITTILLMLFLFVILICSGSHYVDYFREIPVVLKNRQLSEIQFITYGRIGLKTIDWDNTIKLIKEHKKLYSKKAEKKEDGYTINIGFSRKEWRLFGFKYYTKKDDFNKIRINIILIVNYKNGKKEIANKIFCPIDSKIIINDYRLLSRPPAAVQRSREIR